MSIGIIDAAVDSIQATRKVLIIARSSPNRISVPENALKTIVHASIAGAILLLINRLFLYPPESDDPTKYVSTIGINILVSMTSLIPTFAVSVLAALTRRDEEAEVVADRWLLVITYIWIVALMLHFGWQMIIVVFGIEDILRNIANSVPGRFPLGRHHFDFGAVTYSFFFSFVAFGTLVYRSSLIADEKKKERQSSRIFRHLITFAIAGLPCVVMLSLTLYLTLT